VYTPSSTAEAYCPLTSVTMLIADGAMARLTPASRRPFVASKTWPERKPEPLLGPDCVVPTVNVWLNGAASARPVVSLISTSRSPITKTSQPQALAFGTFHCFRMREILFEQDKHVGWPTIVTPP
jgi:hypothetical protein